MNVLLVNGSPHADGCTFTALGEVAKALEAEGIGTRIFQIGTKPVGGCIACRACGRIGRCGIDDVVNDFLELAGEADGFVIGSPVHYAAAAGSITGFLDRAFRAGAASGKELFRLKPAAAVVSARRAGTTAALDQLSKYFTISEMPVISSNYWNMVHGSTPEDVLKDEEGLQVMRTLGRNMAWFLRCKDAAAKAGIALPSREPKVMTNFIRA